jgi:proliferating cell nuclear antigen PCNA
MFNIENDIELQFKTSNSFYFKNIINLISNILDKANVKFNSNGMRITSLDGANISLIDMLIPNNFFEIYTFNSDLIVGINFSLLNKILNNLNMNNILTFKINKDLDKVIITILGPNYKNNYEMKIIDIEEFNFELNTYDNSTNITLDSKYFNKIISKFDENLEICINKSKKTITLNNSNKKIYSLEMCLDLNNLTNYIHSTVKNHKFSHTEKLDFNKTKYENLQDLSLEFYLKYILRFSKGYILSNIIKLSMKKDYPIKISYEIYSNGFINYYITENIKENK